MTQRSVPGWLVLIAALTAVGPVTIDMYLPALPTIACDLAAQGVERTMAAYFLGLVFGQLFYGPVSDRFGRKPPLYASLTIYAIGSIGCAFAPNIEMLIATRMLQALGGSAGIVIGRAIVRDRCEPHEAAKAFSTLMLIVALAPVVSPVIGGWIITHSGWRAVFALQAALAAVLLTAMHFMLTESRDPALAVSLKINSVMTAYGRLLKDPMFLGYSLSLGCAIGTLFAYVTGSPVVLSKAYALTPQAFGWIVGLNGVAFILAGRLNIISLRTRAPQQALRRVIFLPLLWSLALFAVSFFGPPLWLVVALQFCLFFSHGRISPNLVTLALAEQGRQAGTASSLLGSLQASVSTIAGVAVATFTRGSLQELALIMTIGGALVWLFYFSAARARE